MGDVDTWLALLMSHMCMVKSNHSICKLCPAIYSMQRYMSAVLLIMVSFTQLSGASAAACQSASRTDAKQGCTHLSKQTQRPGSLWCKVLGCIHHMSEGTYQVAWPHESRGEGNNMGEETPIGGANRQGIRSAIRKPSYATSLWINCVPLKYTAQCFVHNLYVWPIPASDNVPRRGLRLWGQQNHTSLHVQPLE